MLQEFKNGPLFNAGMPIHEEQKNSTTNKPQTLTKWNTARVAEDASEGEGQ